MALKDEVMSGLKTLGLGAIALVAGAAQASTPVDLPREFATCAGRYSAMVEHAWLMQAAEAEDYARLRGAFVSLLEATDEGAGVSRLHRRVDAKAAHAQLLQVATFSTDPERASLAQQQSEAHLAACRRLVLGG